MAVAAATQGWSVAGKSWVALIGSLFVSLTPMIPTIAGVLPLPWGPVLTGLGIILAALTKTATYHAPYQPTTAPPIPPAAPTTPAPWPGP